MKFFGIFLFLNVQLIIANVTRNRRSQIDDFLKNVFVDASLAGPTGDIATQQSLPTAKPNGLYEATDRLIDACRKDYDDEYCFQTIFGSNSF